MGHTLASVHSKPGTKCQKCEALALDHTHIQLSYLNVSTILEASSLFASKMKIGIKKDHSYL